MNWPSWYKALEYSCQLLACALLAFVCWRLTRESADIPLNTTINIFSPLLLMALLFFLLSMFFRYLDSAHSSNSTSPFILNLQSMFAALDITGIHLAVLLFAISLASIGAIEHSSDTINLTKYIFGVFVGMQVEKKRTDKIDKATKAAAESS